MNDDLYSLLNEVIRERDELIDRLESCRMALDDMTEHAEEFKAEVRRMKEERDRVTEMIDNLEHLSFIEGLLFYIAIRLGDKESLMMFLETWGKECEKLELEELGVRGDEK